MLNLFRYLCQGNVYVLCSSFSAIIYAVANNTTISCSLGRQVQANGLCIPYSFSECIDRNSKLKTNPILRILFSLLSFPYLTFVKMHLFILNGDVSLSTELGSH